MKELSHLNKYLFKYKFLLILGIIFLAVSNYFAVWPARVVRYALDYVTESFGLYRAADGSAISSSLFDDFETGILILGGLIIVMALTRGFFLFLVRQTIIVMSRKIEFDLKNEVFDQYQKLPLSFYRKNNTGDLMNRISEDVTRVRMYLGPGIMYGINLLILFPMVIYEMLRVNAELTFYALLPLPVLSVSIYLVNNIINKRSEEIQESLSDLSTHVQEAFSGIRVLKAFVREMDSSRKFNIASEEYKDKSLKLTFVNALFFPLIMALIGLSIILTIYIGGNKVIKGEITYGNIAEFVLYVNMLTWPVTALGWITSIIQRAAASQKRINQFLKEENHIQSTENLDVDIAGKLAFENVSFVYPDSGIKALDQVSFEVSPGESIAIIGTTGSGKSTIANLILRLYDTTQGGVKIDGKPIEAYDISSMRSQMGYVPQDVFLFSDSIENNIAFGGDDITKEQIIQAAKDADLYDNIDDFPEGFQTMLGERGITLSGGQKQRTSIARAIVKNPKLLILDDALSAVDTNTENTILKSLARIMKGRTSVIISHRVSSAKLADKIIVLDDGKIIEQGTNESLLAAGGVYKELYDKQLKQEEEA
ncbi:ABC transporter ATP-binding protein [Roseivirga pacifica]|uniref:ABC transporter ATP-binding protein n=1 Tax=Roseivirga pacifica TaxID=1267423 RepID=UPI002095DF31|nr:ABC transporter ATP-binding protein [Roseivirga pacifica]MCO6359985.1 ATP-binding cassette domain-containing protein [Roseivirga pacifica]MCO6367355.1 ATP-binding cassette domain-containing protein [Roseivirga pacifica]MCO6370114.1 ATP-binding cassette domain-containing protein [Roseivirga pacifica]MCO6375012.1 ATP-binding cassette domain-containing protein [Roseivirga pacifica]MCO6380270.1 ATP-binding cassette domain-containing protein [Roseivirga pacifica]